MMSSAMKQPRSTEDSIREILCDLFGVSPELVSLETSRSDVPGWDSLQHLNLLLDIEAKLHVRLPEDSSGNVTSLRDLVRLVDTQINRNQRSSE